MTKGLYVQTHNGEVIHSVQVEDSTGMQWPLDPQEYAARGHQPLIDQLPTLEIYTVNNKVNEQQMLCRIELLTAEMDANDEENSVMQSEIDSLHSRINSNKIINS